MSFSLFSISFLYGKLKKQEDECEQITFTLQVCVCAARANLICEEAAQK